MLAVALIVVIYIYRFIIGGITGGVSEECQAMLAKNGGNNEIVYGQLADWIKTQSTSLVSVTDAYYQNDAKKGDQIVIKYSTLNNYYSGKKILDAKTLQKYCNQ
jgi:hypothetical protein